MNRTLPTETKNFGATHEPIEMLGLSETYHRHLMLDHVAAAERADDRRRFEALAHALRDVIAPRWLHTQNTHDRLNAKRVCYMSMEFLLGRSLRSNICNLDAERVVRECLGDEAANRWEAVCDAEPDAGLGNGGLGRLAACFLESLATLEIPAFGYGLRYEYGMFHQSIKNGYQVERPDRWLMRADPWEIACPDDMVIVPLGCSFRLEGSALRTDPGRPSRLIGMPFDRPVVGFGGRTINTLRLWGAAASDEFDLGDFSSGDFIGAILDRMVAETVTRVLYPDDSTVAGQALRFMQEYFLVSCSITDIVRRFRRLNSDWETLSEKAAVQLNDTHPSLAVAELMRVLLDNAGLGWDRAYEITQRTLAYTNHTLLPEALEKWPVRFFELICPRLLEILYEMNARHLDEVRQRHPGDEGKVRRMSLIEEGDGLGRQVRMAHVAVVGTHSTNGVAKIHSDLLRNRVLADFAEMFPERFNNKTNGVTPRRWLLQANPELAKLITEAIGPGWAGDLGRLQALAPLADDAAFQAKFRRAKGVAKVRFASWLHATTGQEVDPNSIYDSHIKRIHEYKRQLLNAIHIVVLYNRLRADPALDVPSRTFFFGGKAAPAYRFAKLIIKLISNIGATIDADPVIRKRLKVIFMSNYNVSLAERLIPATDISEQISTAGFEASGTGNMKFMMNGALTIGTRDGATIEMAEEVGERNIFLFGLSAAEVQGSTGWYSPRWHYENEPETRAALDLMFSDHFSVDEQGIFNPIREAILDRGDHYMHLADLKSYAAAHESLTALHARPHEWARAAILNVAASGRFSSDRTIKEYASEIWNCPSVPIQ